MKNLKRLFCLAIVLIIISAQVSAIEDIGEKNNPANEMKIRMVLFTPADKSLPEEYKERYKQVADYAESFFSKWMNHWGYSCKNPLKIERDEQGYPNILVVKGKQNYDFEGYQKLNGIRKEVVERAKSEYGISDEKQVWWILNYPRRNRGSRGGGNVQNGGTCFANYVDAEAPIEIDADFASGIAEEILLKSLIHELTHALGVGHIGPRIERDLGNSLMGPVNKAYKKFYENDSRVYLSEAAAAILWKHPLFDGNENESYFTPKVQTENVNVSFNKSKGQILVEGKLKSNSTAHSVVISDASKGNKSPYWHRAFVSKVNPDGTFKCEIFELKEANGELVVGFCFKNGAITGNGTKLGLNSSGIKIPYYFSVDNFTFDIK